MDEYNALIKLCELIGVGGLVGFRLTVSKRPHESVSKFTLRMTYPSSISKEIDDIVESVMTDVGIIKSTYVDNCYDVDNSLIESIFNY